jgi:hypothetical protein
MALPSSTEFFVGLKMSRLRSFGFKLGRFGKVSAEFFSFDNFLTGVLSWSTGDQIMGFLLGPLWMMTISSALTFLFGVSWLDSFRVISVRASRAERLGSPLSSSSAITRVRNGRSVAKRRYFSAEINGDISWTPRRRFPTRSSNFPHHFQTKKSEINLLRKVRCSRWFPGRANFPSSFRYTRPNGFPPPPGCYIVASIS